MHLHNSNHPTLRFYIPLVRTLLPGSAGTIARERAYPTVHEDGVKTDTEPVEQIPLERVLKYLPIGNYKWYVFAPPQQEVHLCYGCVVRSTIEVDNSNPVSPTAKLEVVIDGKVCYRHTIKGSPIPRSTTMELGALVPAFRDMVLKIGIKPRTWF